MSYDKYYSEGKYKCNHPESDFAQTTTNPIEMKKEHFVEYTRRNETANYRYDVWNESENISKTQIDPLITLDRDDFENIEDYYAYVKIKANSANLNNPKNTTTSSNKKSSSLSLVFIFILIYILPIIFSVIGTILEMIFDSL